MSVWKKFTEVVTNLAEKRKKNVARAQPEKKIE